MLIARCLNNIEDEIHNLNSTSNRHPITKVTSTLDHRHFSVIDIWFQMYLCTSNIKYTCTSNIKQTSNKCWLGRPLLVKRKIRGKTIPYFPPRRRNKHLNCFKQSPRETKLTALQCTLRSVNLLSPRTYLSMMSALNTTE